MSLRKIIFFRCDSSTDIGGGHVMRCLALSEMLEEANYTSEFICKDLKGSLNSIIENSGRKLHLIPQDSSVTEELNIIKNIVQTHLDPVFVSDSYTLPDTVRLYFLETGFSIAINDSPESAPPCHLLIDTNVHHEVSARYEKVLPYFTGRLLGPEHSILRKEFRSFVLRAFNPKKSNVVVFFGSGDASGNTLKFLNAVEKGKSSIYFDVIVSRVNKDFSLISSFKPIQNVTLHFDPESVAKIFADSALYFGSGGTVTWERLFCGLPGIVVSVAENQDEIAKYLSELGAQIYLGRIEEINLDKAIDNCDELVSDPIQRSRLSSRGLELVGLLDVENINGPIDDLRVRSATKDDAKFLFELRRDPSSAHASANQNDFDFASHVDWLESKLADSKTSVFVVMFKQERIGQVRIDSDAVVSIALLPAFQSKGLGGRILNIALETDLILKKREPAVHFAWIANSNIGSEKTFVKSGFKKVEGNDERHPAGKFSKFRRDLL